MDLRRRCGEHCRAVAGEARGLDRLGLAVVLAVLAVLIAPAVACMALVSSADSPMAGWPALLVGIASSTVLLLLAARTWVSVLVLLPLLLFQPVEWFAVRTCHSQVSPAMFAVFSLTNPAEAAGFFAGHWLAVAAVIVVAVAGSAAAVLVLRRRRFAVPLRLRLTALAGAALLVLAAALGQGGGWAGAGTAMAASPGMGSAVRFAQMLAQRARVERFAAVRAAYRHGAVATRPEADQLVILVIGESLRAGNLGIDGYARPTTPRLARREGLVALADVVSCSHLTTLALPPALTGQRADDHAAMERRSSLVAACREAGFATCWLSNQAPTGPWDELVASYAREAATVRWMNPAPLVSEWGRARAYDDVLVAAAAEEVARMPGRALLVVHLMGSHMRYELRYPPGSAVFLPATTAGAGESYRADPVAMRNAYDNSVVATDAVVDACIALHERSGRPGFVMFVADHGESLYDDARGFQGHGNLPPPAVEFRVPWLAWPSPTERRLHPGPWAMLAANRGRPASTRDLFHTLLDLAGIAIREADPARCLGGPGYREQPRQLIDIGGRLLDFDRDIVPREPAP